MCNVAVLKRYTILINAMLNVKKNMCQKYNIGNSDDLLQQR